MQPGPALVTGATGFVGANVARLLLEQGYELRCLARPGSDRRNLPAHPAMRIVEGDLREPVTLRKAVQGCREVYHVAADYRFWVPRPRELYESNVAGTANLMRAAGDAGVSKIVYTSTVGTVGLSSLPEAADEETPAIAGQFDGHYKRSKHQAEELVMEFARQGLPVVVVNPSTPIGAWDRKPTPTGRIIVDFINGKIPAYVDTGLNLAHVRDVAWGHLLAARRGRVGERYILGGTNHSMIEFLALLAQLTGRSAPKVRLPYGMAWCIGWASTRLSDWVTRRAPAVALEAVRMSKRHMYYDSSKAIRELGLPQTPIREAAREALSWFSRNGFLSTKLERGSQLWQSR